MKRIVLLIFACSLLFVSFASCYRPGSGNNTESSKTAVPSLTSENINSIPPELKFQGLSFDIGAPGPTGPDYFDCDSPVSGDQISEAIYTRNRRVEERFEITINSLIIGGSGNAAEYLLPYIKSGDDVIDIMATAFTQSAKPLIVNDLIIPWNGAKYINLSQPWWNTSITETLSLNNNYYFLGGDINWFTFAVTSAFFFNKKVAEEYQIGDIYQIVKDGNWTQELMMTLAKSASQENGDGVRDIKDKYGLCVNSHHLESFVYGRGMQLVSFSDNGVDCRFDSEEMVDLIDRLGSFLKNNEYVWLDDGNETLTQIFFDDRALFACAGFNACEEWRNQDSNFGILPLPKASEKQDKYYTYSDQWGMALAIPMTATDKDRTGAIIETMAQYSYEYIRPAWYEKTLTGKYTRDDESEEMLDIIYSNVLYDPGYMFITNLEWMPFTNCVKRGEGLISWYDARKSVIMANFKDLYDYVWDK